MTGIKSLIPAHTKPEDHALSSFTIKVLGVDIEAARIYELRRQQMYLSENPPVFTGTLRENIDPFNKYTDDDIVRTLDYFGFYESYSAYIKAREQQDVIDFVKRNVRYQNEFRHEQSGCCTKRKLN